MHKYIISLFICHLSCWTIYGQQIVISDLGFNIGQLSFEELSQYSISNVGNAVVEGELEVFLLDQSQLEVVRISSFSIQLAPGQSMSGTEIPWRRQLVYGNSPFSALASQTGTLSNGLFVKCYEFKNNSGIIIEQSCREINAEAQLFFDLIYPFNSSSIAETRPVFSWMPLTSAGRVIPGLGYDFVLVEIS
ncbi:MAG: hypothetical protein AAFY91_02375, partial [Bacteroidota bacterium]